ncbi:OLC1v1037452C1 [Oldenlandia corymbosa var. corymbosa]|uniref:OLC1v1037452C1 n=1 Tax=Oldenlandia corymbosa var. corymbosa TaxID=529605 RepID=A0AAV1E243_OLDCO|nr:OLC1v1037452C1 [Oldenlandia corymbosa var. corymbosa]
MHGSSGCVGSSLYPKLASSIDEPLNQQIPEVPMAPTVYKGSTPESFWTTSNCDYDASTFQSPGSISSVSTSVNDPLSAGCSNASSEFVNHGLHLWKQSRKQWVGSRKSYSQVQQSRAPKLSWNATYDSMLGSNKPFPKPIRLAEMVDFLVDVWEQDGMYD